MKTLNLIKQTATLGFIASTILIAPLTSQALTVEEVTNPQSKGDEWVTDMANILSDETETDLNQLITNLEQTNGAEIAIVTVPETAPATSPKAFATQLFNHWGIGKAEANNGILFLISQGDRRVEIETGYGVSSILPDAQVTNIIDRKITPQYKKGNYDQGTLDGTKALISSLNPTSKIQDSSKLNFKIIEQTKVNSPVIKTSSSSLLLFFILFVLFILLVSSRREESSSGSNSSSKKSKKRHGYSDSSNNVEIDSGNSGSFGGYFGGDSSDSGNSGGDFGGGSSDGGGAGGNW